MTGDETLPMVSHCSQMNKKEMAPMGGKLTSLSRSMWKNFCVVQSGSIIEGQILERRVSHTFNILLIYNCYTESVAVTANKNFFCSLDSDSMS